MASLIDRLNELHSRDPSPDAIAASMGDPLSRWFPCSAMTPELYQRLRKRRIAVGRVGWIDLCYKVDDWDLPFIQGHMASSGYWFLDRDLYVEGMLPPCR